ncbi:MAG: hypothetical protein FJX53_11035 [Alphaproteobacteria bacterium]|nr:hypothetical protein [Alphaproteobacteria bacterium]
MAGLKRDLQARAERRLQATTVGDLAHRGIAVFCWCNRCSHNAALPAATLVAKLGPHFPVPEVGGKLRCTSCGARDVASRPEWPSLGKVAGHS